MDYDMTMLYHLSKENGIAYTRLSIGSVAYVK